VILWLNGTFGVGKSTTTRHVVEAEARWRVFDPEWVGYMLRANLDGFDFDDFQELGAWRRLVPQVASEISSTTGSNLIAVQTVLVATYWSELRHGMEREGLGPFHVVLDCDESTLRARIADDLEDPGAAEWRLRHVDEYRTARAWMIDAADLVVDTTRCDAASAARLILAAVNDAR
jgi:hypothetical protein